MSIKVYDSNYKDQPCITIESDSVKSQFLPHIGAKMVSLIDKKTGMEFMQQRNSEKYLVQPYDGNYLAGECSGFDDMFPTIDECHCEDYPWKGTRVPDHGEVWALEWKYEVDSEQIYMHTYGVRFPYKMEKWIRFTTDKILRIIYKLTNLSSFNMDFIWAAHMMLNIEEGAKVFVPDGLERAVCTFSKSGIIGNYGDEFSWPDVKTKTGEIYKADLIRSRKTNDTQKYYFKEKLTDGWCAVKYPGKQLV